MYSSPMARTLTTEIEITEPPYNTPWYIPRYFGLARKHSGITELAKLGHVLRCFSSFLSLNVSCYCSPRMGGSNPTHLKRPYNLPQVHYHHPFTHPTISTPPRSVKARTRWSGPLSHRTSRRCTPSSLHSRPVLPRRAFLH